MNDATTLDADEARALDRDPGDARRRVISIVLIVLLLVGLVYGVLYWIESRRYESTDDAFVDAHIVRVAPTVGGTLVRVPDFDNRHVAAGTVLAVIKRSGPEAQFAEARASAAQAEAQIETARAQVVGAEAQRAQAIAQSRSPLAAADKAAKDLARYEALQKLDPTAVAPLQIDAARTQARQTAAEAQAARSQIDSAEAAIRVAARQVAAAQSARAARRAVVAQAGVTLGDLVLSAPVAGQVVNRSVDVGSYVAPGTSLMAIVPDHIWVTANFKETQLQRMRRGQRVAIRVDAFPDVKFTGRVDSVQRGAGQAFTLLPAQNATGNYVKVVQRVPVRIEFDTTNGPDPRRYPIGPGMSVVPTVTVR